jgi:hypothetical protein
MAVNTDAVGFRLLNGNTVLEDDHPVIGNSKIFHDTSYRRAKNPRILLRKIKAAVVGLESLSGHKKV